MAADYRSIVRWQNDMISSRPEIQTNYPLKLKYTNVAPVKFGGRKRASSNSGQVGRAYRSAKRRTSPGAGQCGYRAG